MSQIDHSIYFQQQTPDIVGSIQKGLSMRDMMDQRKARQAAEAEQAQIKGVFAQNVGEDGQLDRKATLSSLTKINPEKALAYQEKFNSLDQADMQKNEMGLKQKLGQLDFVGRLVGGVTDEASYQQARKAAQDAGLDVSQLPPMYDPNIMKRVQMQALSAKEQLQMQMDQAAQARSAQVQNRQLGQKDRELSQKDIELGIKERDKREKANSAKVEGLAIAPGAMPTADDAKKVKAALVQRDNIVNSLDKLEKMVESEGTEAFSWGSESSNMAQLATDARMGAKDLYQLGVLTGPDMELLESVIPDPSDWGWAFTPNAAAKVKAQLARAKDIIKEKAGTIASTRGYEVPGAAPTPGGRGIVQKGQQAGQKSVQQMAREELMRRQQQRKQNAGATGGF